MLKNVLISILTNKYLQNIDKSAENKDTFQYSNLYYE